MTDDDHLLHNAFTGVAWRPTYFLQFGMSNFLRWNPHQTSGQLTGIAKGTTGEGLRDVAVHYSLPSMSEIKYLDTTYPDTLIGEARIEKRKVELKDASTNPRHLRANYIIRIR